MNDEVVPPETLRAIQEHFHRVIRGRAGDLVDEHRLTLPELSPVPNSVGGPDDDRAWFPVPGMCGGFAYRMEGGGREAKLIVESWCRVVWGSGQRHEITAEGSQLVAEGFV